MFKAREWNRFTFPVTLSRRPSNDTSIICGVSAAASPPGMFVDGQRQLGSWQVVSLQAPAAPLRTIKISSSGIILKIHPPWNNTTSMYNIICGRWNLRRCCDSACLCFLRLYTIVVSFPAFLLLMFQRSACLVWHTPAIYLSAMSQKRCTLDVWINSTFSLEGLSRWGHPGVQGVGLYWVSWYVLAGIIRPSQAVLSSSACVVYRTHDCMCYIC